MHLVMCLHKALGGSSVDRFKIYASFAADGEWLRKEEAERLTRPDVALRRCIGRGWFGLRFWLKELARRLCRLAVRWVAWCSGDSAERRGGGEHFSLTGMLAEELGSVP